MEILDKIDKYLNEVKMFGLKSGVTVKNIKVNSTNTIMKMYLKNGDIVNISCFGGNDLEIIGDKNKIKNDTIKDLKFKNDYHLIVKFEGNKKIEIIDDTGGEGIEVSVE